MSISHTMTDVSRTFPAGTVVGAYVDPMRDMRGAAPPSAALDTDTVSATGEVTFTGLAYATRYVAYANGRYVGFRTRAQPALVTVDTTDTLVAGSSATVDVVGDDETGYALSFGIPAGATGPRGPQGVKGDTGDRGLKGDTGAVGQTGAATGLHVEAMSFSTLFGAGEPKTFTWTFQAPFAGGYGFSVRLSSGATFTVDSRGSSSMVLTVTNGDSPLVVELNVIAVETTGSLVVAG